MAPFEPLAFAAAGPVASAPAEHPWRENALWIGLAVFCHVLLLTSFALIKPPEPIQPPIPFAVEILNAANPDKPDTPKPQPKVEKRPAPQPPIPVSKTPLPTALTTKAEPTPPAVETPPSKTSGEPAPSAGQPVSQPQFDAAYLNNPAPAYPPMSRRLGETGKVFLRVHVLPSGLPDQLEIRTSSGFPRLDSAALDAVKRWRFVPAKQGGETLAAWVVVPISFSLEN
ncbi:hypothetical protein DLREEDagrD3_27030 [Denitratisoma sp. agr-D3]